LIRSARRVAGLAVLLALPLAAWSQQEDLPEEVPGGHDHPAVKRYPGAVLTELNEQEAETMPFPLSATQTKLVEGKSYEAQYVYPLKASCTQVLAAYEKAFKAAGLTTRSGDARPKEVTWLAHRWVSGEGRYRGKTGDLYVVATCNDDPDYHAGDLFVMEAEAAERPEQLTASALAADLARSGRVALSGSELASDKAGFSAEAERSLAQISALLKSRPELKLRIEVHTDNAGPAKENLERSKKRAEALKAWLVKKGIDSKRLTAEGYGDQKPIAPNDSEEGRAKNRRVELVKL